MNLLLEVGQDASLSLLLLPQTDLLRLLYDRVLVDCRYLLLLWLGDHFRLLLLVSIAFFGDSCLFFDGYSEGVSQDRYLGFAVGSLYF